MGLSMHYIAITITLRGKLISSYKNGEKLSVGLVINSIKYKVLDVSRTLVTVE